MNFSRYISKTLNRFLPVVAGALLWGCTADEVLMPEAPEMPEGDVQLRITLAIPQGESIKSQTRAVEGDGPVISPAQTAEDNELRIQDIRLYIFPESADHKAEVALNLPLRLPTLSTSKTVETYFINGLTGGSKYTLYLLANFGDDASNLTTEEALEKKVIDYTSNAHNLVPGNLPMVYKHGQTVQIPIDGSETIDAVMKYACAKIRYNVIFDKTTTGRTETRTHFQDKSLVPSSLTLSNITKESKILWDRDRAFYPENKAADKTLGMAFYTSWNPIPQTAPTDGSEWVTNVSGSIGAAPTASPDKWLLRGTVYVPERYVNASTEQTTLTLKSKIGSSEVEHGTPIGIADGDGNFLDLDRSTYYELVGTIVNTNLKGVQWDLNVQSWEEKTINADFVHTFLHLENTSTTVTSFDDGIIGYDTDGRGAISLECDNDAKITIDGNTYKLFEIGPAPADASGMKQLAIQVNSDVPILKLNEMGKASGTAHAFIVAGNIKKRIEIEYNIEPFIEFTPVSMKIQDGDGVDPSSRFFEYRTNCGGFIMTCEEEGHSWEFTDLTTEEVEHKITSDGSNYSSFKMKFRENQHSSSEGIIEITENHPDLTTVVHSFVVKAREKLDGFPEDIYVNVEIMPKKENYRVYFRAINDYHTSNDAEFGTVPAEQTTTGTTGNNWNDYWTNHYLYAYTQYGETPNKMPVWRYTSDYGFTSTEFSYKNPTTNEEFRKHTPEMTKDAGNPGWYFYDLPVSCVGNYVREGDADDATAEQKKKYGNGPLPGATLMIFYSNNGDPDIHRVNQNKDAGIPLGDYNDYESWVLYDPTRDPVYNVYDDKPIVVNTQFVVYSDTKFTKWENYYGGNYIYKNLPDIGSDDPDYAYKYIIELKTPRGEYDKNITLVSDESADPFPVVAVGVYGSDWGKGTPYALFNDGGSGAGHEEWVIMRKIPGKTEFYLPVPNKWKGKKVKFCDNNLEKYTNNFNISTENKIQFCYTDNASTFFDKTNDYKATLFKKTTLMYGGKSWVKGYYKSTRPGNNKWSSNP